MKASNRSSLPYRNARGLSCSMEKNHVLIVDDEPSVRESLRIVLKDRYEILTANAGAAALEIVERQPVDVVLLDILMPGLDGLEVLERLRQRAAAPQVI